MIFKIGDNEIGQNPRLEPYFLKEQRNRQTDYFNS